MKRNGIRCPLCGWSPRKEDKWFCECGHEWNTFDTAGVCPACLHQWTSTQCLSCSRWSAHSEWSHSLTEKNAPCGEKSFSATTPIHAENRLLSVLPRPVTAITVQR